MNLFDENKRFQTGVKDLNIWPFYRIDERLGCMKEYKGRSYNPDENRQKIVDGIHNMFTKLVMEFESFICPMYYSSRDIDQIQEWELLLNEGDLKDKEELMSS